MDERSRAWFVGVDWASQDHHAVVVDAPGRKLGERSFRHGGEGLAALAAWITALTEAEPDTVEVAIEAPHGPVVETLVARGFRLHAINPKQLDRFRDRFSPAGAKDDSRDAQVLADALRTDPRYFRRLQPLDPRVVERLRLVNRQIKDAEKRLDHLTEQLATAATENENTATTQRDVTILRSLPGAARCGGRVVIATLLARASEALQRRDYHPLRCLCGVAPVTKGSGKSRIVLRRQAAHNRLANAAYHWARVAVQRDPRSRQKYAALRQARRRHPVRPGTPVKAHRRQLRYPLLRGGESRAKRLGRLRCRTLFDGSWTAHAGLALAREIQTGSGPIGYAGSHPEGAGAPAAPWPGARRW